MKITAVESPIQPKIITHGGMIERLRVVALLVRGALTRVGVGELFVERDFDSKDERRLELGEGVLTNSPVCCSKGVDIPSSSTRMNGG